MQPNTITIKASKGDDLRRFVISSEEMPSLITRLTSIWTDMAAPRVTYLDDDGDSVTLASEADISEALDVLSHTQSTTLRVTVVDSTEQHPVDSDFPGLLGNGKNCRGGKGKGHRIAAALGISIEEARDLLHKAHDGNQEARNTLQELRATHVAEKLGIEASVALDLIQRAHSGEQEAKDQLRKMRRSMLTRHHHPGKSHGKGRMIAAAAGISVDEARALIEEARNGDSNARAKLREIRKIRPLRSDSDEATEKPASFPAHWGEPPRMQTKDLRQLPGGYGMGSGTLCKWIQGNMDAAPPPAPAEQEQDNAQRELMQGYTSRPQVKGKGKGKGGKGKGKGKGMPRDNASSCDSDASHCFDLIDRVRNGDDEALKQAPRQRRQCGYGKGHRACFGRGKGAVVAAAGITTKQPHTLLLQNRVELRKLKKTMAAESESPNGTE